MKILSKYYVGDLPVYCVQVENPEIKPGNKIICKYGKFDILSIEKFTIGRPLQIYDKIGIMIVERLLEEGDEIILT